MSNGTTLRPANRCRMASWRASTADCVTSASTSTCSPTSRRHARSSKNGGSTTTPTDRTRALTGLHRLSSQHAPHQGITGTDSPYKRGQVGEQVITTITVEGYFSIFKRGMEGVYQHCKEKHCIAISRNL